MTGGAQRICSLLPSTTEIVYALGLEDRLVSVTHECDFPPAAAEKPQVTSSVIDSEGLTAVQIDAAVRDSLDQERTIYHLDRAALEELAPDLILTQELCTVCAVGTGEVQSVVGSLSCNPNVVSLEPRTLSDVLDTILLVGRLTDRLRRAIEVADTLRDRIQSVRDAVAGSSILRVLTLEWTDPVFVGGHWVPEMVELAGGADVLGRAGEPSREVRWEEVVASAPDVVVAMPCGFGVQRSVEELARATLPAAWNDLPAVKSGEVYVVDGSSYFNRPGPRLVDGIEILAAILHPDRCSRAPQGSFLRFSQTVPSRR